VAPKFRATPQRLLTGLAEIDRRLSDLPLAPANRIARKGLSVAVRLLARRMRAMVTSGGPTVKKALKGYVRKTQEDGGKRITAKAGGVGKQADKAAQAAKKKHAASGKRGVGISSRNIHWWLMGTRDRTQKQTGRRTGQMPAQSVVKTAASSGMSEALEAMADKCREALAEEVKKLGGKP
jgi:hypothetical protein